MADAVVYGTGTRGTTVHRTPDCQRLNINRIAPVMEFDFSRLHRPVLCKACFDRQPILRVMHTRCCSEIVRPCQHNGGVLVFDPNDTYRRMRYAWPEDAGKFTLVNPVHVS